MNSKKTFVAINFDLDTKKLKNIYVQQTGKKYNQAYYDIKSFMKKNGFSHRQGSGYLSKNPTTETSATFMIKRMSAAMPWLKSCVRRIDLTIVGDQHDLTGILNQKNSSPQLSVKKTEIKDNNKSNTSHEETITIPKKEYDAIKELYDKAQKANKHSSEVIPLTNLVFNEHPELKEAFKKAKEETLQRKAEKEKGGLNDKKSENKISEHKKKSSKPKL